MIICCVFTKLSHSGCVLLVVATTAGFGWRMRTLSLLAINGPNAFFRCGRNARKETDLNDINDSNVTGPAPSSTKA